MKKITRRLAAALLCALLVLCAPFAAALTGAAGAQVQIWLADGTGQTLPVQIVTTSLGDVVYWLDQTQLTDEQRAALPGGTLVLTDAEGNVIWQQPLVTEGQSELVSDIPMQVGSPENPQDACTVMLGDWIAAPMSPEEADEALYPFGFETPQPYIPEETPTPTPEPTDTPTPEPTDTPTPEPTDTPTPEPTDTPTPEPTDTPTPEPTDTPTPEPTDTPTPEPTDTPTPEPTDTPTPEPTDTPTPEVTEPPVIPEETEVPVIPEETEVPEVDVPQFVVPNQDLTNLRSAPYMSEATEFVKVNASDLLIVEDYERTEDGAIWWVATDYRTQETGYVISSVVSEVDAAEAAMRIAAIDEERQQPEETEAPEETTAPEIPEETEAPVTPEETKVPETPEETEAPVTPEETEAPVVPEETEAPQVRSGYAVTSGKNGTNNLRAEPNGSAKYTQYKNGELVLLGEAFADDGGALWYPVTMLSTGETGYMRDFLLTELSVEEAQKRLDELASKLPETPDAGDQTPDAGEPTPDAGEPTPDAGEPTPDAGEPTPDAGEPTPDAGEPTPDAGEPTPDAGEQTPDAGEQTPDSGEVAFPAYAITVEQENNAAIVLVEAPDADPPSTGRVTLISRPTPLELTGSATGEDGTLWYLARNMCAGNTGYIPAYKVRLVGYDEAAAAVYEVEQVPEYNPPVVEETATPEVTETPYVEITPTPEPDTPQELADGEIWHYGRTNDKAVNFRKGPGAKYDSYGKLAKGTVVWVMEKDGDWCSVRVSLNGKMTDGYIKSSYIDLMGVREEAEYIATLENPETAPVPTETPVPEDTVTPVPEDTPTPVPEDTETPAPEDTPTPAPEETETPVPEDTPTPVLEDTPTPVPEDTPTPSPEITATPAPQGVNTYALVLADGTAVRSNTDDYAALQTRLSANTVVYVSQRISGGSGVLWYDITYGESQWGYVHEDQLRLMSDEEVAAYLESLATPTPSPEPTPTPVPTETPAPQELRIYARVLRDGTPLRGNPTGDAKIQEILSAEDVVYIFQSQISADGMTWYLAQYSGQWGYIRADLVRLMGEQETQDYLAALEAELATPTPMPQTTPEPVGPDSTSAYAKLIKDAVNLRRTPSASGTSLGRIAINTLLLVTGEEYDGTYTWYQVNYNGQDGYVRSDMCKMLTIAELQEYLAQQAQTTPVPGSGVSTTPNSSNNVSYVINGSQLQDLIPVDDSWTNNVINGMPSYATPTPDPNATLSPAPVESPAALISSYGELTVVGVPSTTETGEFSVYGKTKAFATVKATVTMEIKGLPAGYGFELISSAIAESTQTVTRTVGQTVADATGAYTMTVKLPQPGEYIVEFTSDTAFARYGVTYAGAATTAEPTAQPLPTAEPVQEKSGLGIMPLIIGGVLVVLAAAGYGVYVYLRRKEEEEEEEAEDDEEELLREQMNQRRVRRAQSEGMAARTPEQRAEPTTPGVPGAANAPRMPQNQAGQMPSYMRNTPTAASGTGAQPVSPRVSPYAKPESGVNTQTPPLRPNAPVAPKAPTAPTTPVAPKTPTAPTVPVAPKAPTAPTAPVAPKAPTAPVAPETPVEPKAPTASQASSEAPRRRRRPPVDPNA